MRHQVLQSASRLTTPLSNGSVAVNTILLRDLRRVEAESHVSPIKNVVEECTVYLREVAPTEQLHKTKLNRVFEDLPKHYRDRRNIWSNLRQLNKQVAIETTKKVETIVQLRDAAAERERKQRMKLLKENDFGKYLELVKQSKNARIEELLNQTDQFLEDVSLKVSTQQRATHRAREAQKSHPHAGARIGPNVPSSQSPQIDKLRRGSTRAPPSGLYRSVIDQEQTESVKQPDCLVGGKLMPYQVAGLQFLVNLYRSDLSGILADEMGLGKTIQTIALLGYLKEVKNVEGPHLVIVPLSTLPNWISEFERWCPSLSVIQFRGTKTERRELARDVKKGTFNVCVTTYDWIIREKATLAIPYWSFIIVDEGHRMKNVRSKFHMTLSEFQSTHRLLLTGTPLQNNLAELWSLLNFLLPKIFTSATDFELWFEEPFKDFPGQESAAELTEEEKFLIINRLHSVLRPFLLRRVKEDVLNDLPEKREYIIRIQLSMWQKIAYQQLSNKALK